jgi:transposase
MKPVLRPFRRRLAFLMAWFGKLLAIVVPQARRVRTQTMCPFCGLITPRYKMSCLECGKSLEPV